MRPVEVADAPEEIPYRVVHFLSKSWVMLYENPSSSPIVSRSFLVRSGDGLFQIGRVLLQLLLCARQCLLGPVCAG